MRVFLVITILAVAPAAVVAYAEGARSESCYMMNVDHVDSFNRVDTGTNCDPPCAHSLEILGAVVSETNRTRIEGVGSITTYQCGAVYETFVPGRLCNAILHYSSGQMPQVKGSLEILGAVVSETNRTRIEGVGSTTTYQCGAVYEIFLSSSGNQFKGYMVEARETTVSGDFEASSSIWGEWIYDGSDSFHAVMCNRSMSDSEGPFPNAVTQNTAMETTSLSVYWKAPDQPNTVDEFNALPESLTFWVTIVELLLTSFFPIKGPVLARGCDEPIGGTDEGTCLIQYPVTKLDSSNQCPSEQERDEVIESILTGVSTKLTEKVVPFLQGTSDSCDNR